MSQDLSHDDLHEFHRLIMPLIRPPLAVGIGDGSLGFRMPDTNFPALVTILRDGNYHQGSLNLIRSILACVAEIELVPHGHYTACHVQVYIHCDTEPRRPA